MLRKILTITAASILCVLFFSGCNMITKRVVDTPLPAASQAADTGQNPVATITMQSGEVIVLELYPDKAPNTVNNFIALANQGFYDGLIIHRVMAGVLIQGGDPSGDGTGGPGYTIAGEFPNNNFAQNDVKHTAGVISMARRADSYDSAGSQFFICAAAIPSLDGDYAAFGKVVDQDSLDAVIALSQVAATDQTPNNPPVIASIRVDTKGIDYPNPV